MDGWIDLIYIHTHTHVCVCVCMLAYCKSLVRVSLSPLNGGTFEAPRATAKMCYPIHYKALHSKFFNLSPKHT